MARKKVNATVAAEKEPLLEKGLTKKRLSDAGDHDHATKRQRVEERTDYSRWRLRDDHGRHTWHYLEDDDEAKKWPQTKADKYFLGLPLVSIPGSSCYAVTDSASSRTCPTSLSPRIPLTRFGTASNSLKSSNFQAVTGDANMVDPCSSYLVSSSRGT